MSSKPFVIVESPYAGEGVILIRNIEYARACLRDCLFRGEAPYASHLLYTQPGILRDGDKSERELGMSSGWQVMTRADYVVVYMDLGLSSGMSRGIEAASKAGKDVVMRNLAEPGVWDQKWRERDKTLGVADAMRTYAFPNINTVS